MIREEYWGEEWEFSFVVYRPDQETENLPMVIQLHGAGEAGDLVEDLYKVDVHGFSHILNGNEEFPCVFILPQCETDSFWVAEMTNLYHFIQRLQQKFKVDSNRVYLTGLSMGGYGTWYMALRYPQIFAAIAPVCGGGMPWKGVSLDMPIWAFHGSEDDTVDVSETMNMIHGVRKSASHNSEVKMTILDHVGHNAWDYAYTRDLLKWLLSKTR